MIAILCSQYHVNSQRAAKDVSEDMFVKLLNAAKEPAEYDPTFVLPPLYESKPSPLHVLNIGSKLMTTCLLS